MTRPVIYIIAGEVSGDVLGGRLLAALKTMFPNAVLHGIGGKMMQAQGVHSLFPMDELSVMGVAEILPKLPHLLRRVRETADDIVVKQPDIVITIDSPDFVKRVVKRARPHCPDTKFIHYVAPSVWAWRAGRAKTMARLYDGLICLLPFEPPYFEKHGLRAAFCGHPVIETMGEFGQTTRDDNHLLILPGSRRGEVTKMAPIFAETLALLRAKQAGLRASIVALPHVRGIIEGAFSGQDIEYIAPDDRYRAFQNSGMALATSGTVGLELAVAGCPHIIAYRMHPVSFWLAQRLIKVKFAHLVNIMENKAVVPEYLQNDATPEKLCVGLQHLHRDNLSDIRLKLAGHNPEFTPSMQAAQFVASFL